MGPFWWMIGLLQAQAPRRFVVSRRVLELEVRSASRVRRAPTVVGPTGGQLQDDRQAVGVDRAWVLVVSWLSPRQQDDLMLLSTGMPCAGSSPSPTMLFLSRRFPSICPAGASLRSRVSRFRCLTSPVVVVRPMPPAKCFLNTLKHFCAIATYLEEALGNCSPLVKSAAIKSGLQSYESGA